MGTCPAVPPGPCASLGMTTCAGQVCGVRYTAGPAPSQVYGNCRKNTCDATGAMASVEDDTNVFDSGNMCAPYACSIGMLGEALVQGATCTLASATSGVCEPNPDPTSAGDLVCSGCGSSMTSTCSGTTPACVKSTCVANHCTNGTKDGGETDLNCGGPECLPYVTGKSCQSNRDCFSQVCTGGVCQAPSCSDNVQDGMETDVDCGGGGCSPCPDMKKCARPGDCKSGVCRPTGINVPARCQAPTCTDGVKNGSETGVDCGGDGDGGPVCPPCAR